jgi:glycyl-tRNA synthetase
MINLYTTNGLIFWTKQEIKYRNYIKEIFTDEIEAMLRSENRAWHFTEIEAPLLMPRELVNPNYTNEDIFMQENIITNIKEEGKIPYGINYSPCLALRPETTPSSYAYACHMLNSNMILPPFCIHQTGKSFRREQDQVSKNMRLKEFYQQEFQCIYAADTLNDYQEKVLEPLRAMFEKIIGKTARIVESDRLPSYSLRTMDIEIDNGDKWMEICSISKRTDFPQKVKFQTKSGSIEKEMLVLEIAIGLDRCVYNYFK